MIKQFRCEDIFVNADDKDSILEIFEIYKQNALRLIYMQAAFDIHCHFNHEHPFDEVQAKNTPLALKTLDFLRKEGNEFNVQKRAFCGSFHSVLSAENVYRENAFLAHLTEKNDWMYQWVVLNPQQSCLFKQAQELLTRKKALGIKVICEYHGYSLPDYADEIFAFANEQKTAIMMHPDHILHVAQFADKYPNMKLIIAHLGTIEHIQAVKQAKHGNVFVDTSGIASSQNNIIEYAVKELGSEKIFFGTDTYSCAFQKCRVEFARIAKQDKTNILLGNALREFPQLTE